MPEPIKRVVVKATRETGFWSGWSFSVNVDGEEYAAGSAPSYIAALGMAQGYAVGLVDEVDPPTPEGTTPNA